MIVPDLNLLIYAHDPDSPVHESAQRWWTGLLDGTEPVGLPWAVLTRFMRLVSNRATVNPPWPPELSTHGCGTTTSPPSNLDPPTRSVWPSFWIPQTPVPTPSPMPTSPHWPPRTTPSSTAATATFRAFPAYDGSIPSCRPQRNRTDRSKLLPFRASQAS